MRAGRLGLDRFRGGIMVAKSLIGSRVPVAAVASPVACRS
ncbi:hypothetical protein T261_05019 [Streptomyces lydicus]|nr:hypothetical protein T261_05019 [Streptomyces lydicus]